MANRRMISKSISVSDETNKLSDFAALLFTWMIPHTDDWGIIQGTSGKINALVVPRRKKTDKQVEEALKEMQDAQLIWRYEYNGHQYSQLINFEFHQEGLHKRTAPKYPLYMECRHDSEKFREIPGKSPLMETNKKEWKGTEGKVSGKQKYADNVTMTPEEYSKLVDKFGEMETKVRIERISLYKGSSGKWYASDYLTILSWEKRNQGQQRQEGKKSFAMCKLEQMAKEEQKVEPF